MTATANAPTLTMDSINGLEFKVRDLGEAEHGRKELRLAEHEMPGLMALREQYGEKKPLKGLKLMGSLHMQHFLDAGLCGGGGRCRSHRDRGHS